MAASTRSLPTLFVLLMAAGHTLLADEGRIPIFQPTTITSTGSYVVTRDITVASGNVITIQASYVTLDLNGKTLTIQSTVPEDTVIGIGPGASNLRVRNGRVVGGWRGVANLLGGALGVLEVSKVSFSGHGADAIRFQSADAVTVSECRFRKVGNSGVSIQSAALSSAAHIVGNDFSDVDNRAITLTNVRSVEVLNNVISNANTGIETVYVSPPLVPGGSSLIQGNVIEAGSDIALPADGILVYASVGAQLQAALVLDNVVSGFAPGIEVHSGQGARISGNVVHRGVSTGLSNGDGILVFSGAQTLVEGNEVQGNAGCGLVFNAGTNANAYRNNMLRGNGGGAVCNTGVGTTDAGGNIL